MSPVPCPLLPPGADSGIGRSVAVHFAREGAEGVVVCYHTHDDDAKETKRLVEMEGAKCVRGRAGADRYRGQPRLGHAPAVAGVWVRSKVGARCRSSCVGYWEIEFGTRAAERCQRQLLASNKASLWA